MPMASRSRTSPEVPWSRRRLSLVSLCRTTLVRSPSLCRVSPPRQLDKRPGSDNATKQARCAMGRDGDDKKPIPATPADGLKGDDEEDDPPPGFPAKSLCHAAFIDPLDWIDYLPRAYAESMPHVGLTNPGLWNPRNDEWDRYLTDEKKHATRDEYRHLLCYGVFTAAAHAALTDAVATLRAKNATARDTADANDLLDSTIRTIATCGQAAEDRLTYLRRFKCKKALTGEERVAECLV
eukprot:jgi/Tetstr1/438701/TSEL_027250.t1